jgi:hypothetical protein
VVNIVYVRIFAKEVAHFLILLNVRRCGGFCRHVDIEKSSSEGRHECQSPETVQGQMPPSVTRHVLRDTLSGVWQHRSTALPPTIASPNAKENFRLPNERRAPT